MGFFRPGDLVIFNDVDAHAFVVSSCEQGTTTQVTIIRERNDIITISWINQTNEEEIVIRDGEVVTG